jgi:hypothetical protein
LNRFAFGFLDELATPLIIEFEFVSLASFKLEGGCGFQEGSNTSWMTYFF